MHRIWTTELPAHVGESVSLYGWLHHLRRLSNVTFLLLRDGQGIAQIVLEDGDQVALLEGLHHESVLHVEGRVVSAAQAPGGVEVQRPALTVLAASAEAPPIDLFRPKLSAQLPTVLDLAPLTLRHPRRRALFRLASASVDGFRSTLRRLDFVEIQTPKIVASATESGANVFSFDYFGTAAFLAQSPQLYKQIMVGVFERVFEVGPVFRAEPHDTPRHLNEYVSLDLEMGFIEDHTSVMSVLRQALAGMVRAMQDQAGGSLRLLGLTLPVVPDEIPAIAFDAAQELIWRQTGREVRGEPDLAPADERSLGEWALREHGSEFLFVVGYPMVKRPFYTHPNPARPAYSNSFDLLFRGLELVTGGQRLHRYDDYLAALEFRGLSPEPLAGYLQAFKYGMPPHGGFAIGLERWIARLVEAANVRETTLFPRDLQRLTP
jgi:nondiscriminating aspartyl-tRNA synthetase